MIPLLHSSFIANAIRLPPLVEQGGGGIFIRRNGGGDND